MAHPVEWVEILIFEILKNKYSNTDTWKFFLNTVMKYVYFVTEA